jgi:hypothetical protein
MQNSLVGSPFDDLLLDIELLARNHGMPNMNRLLPKRPDNSQPFGLIDNLDKPQVETTRNEVITTGGQLDRPFESRVRMEPTRRRGC